MTNPPTPEHEGYDQAGAPTRHKGLLENCPAPECQDRIAEHQEDAPVVPSADRAALLELAAQAIRDSNGSPEALAWWQQHPQLIPAHVYAAAVLSVLPDPTTARVCPDLIECSHEAALGQAEAKLELVHAAATAWVRPSMSKPSRIAGRHILRLLDDEPDDTDLSEADVDRLMADGTPVQLVSEVEAHRLALSTALGLGTGAPWDAIRDRAQELAGAEAVRARGAELKRRAEVVQSFRELAAQARADGDYEGEASVLGRLAEREQQWARTDAAGEQPDTMRCPDAFWTDRPHPPHTWDQGPGRPVRHCPGKSEQPDTKTETRQGDYERTTGHLITCLAVAGGAADPDCSCTAGVGQDGAES